MWKYLKKLEQCNIFLLNFVVLSETTSWRNDSKSFADSVFGSGWTGSDSVRFSAAAKKSTSFRLPFGVMDDITYAGGLALATRSGDGVLGLMPLERTHNGVRSFLTVATATLKLDPIVSVWIQPL
jgi:hypothetical protein